MATRTSRTCILTLLASSALASGGVLATTTAAHADIAAPTQVRTTDVASQGLAITWNKTGDDAYRVRFATNSAMTADDDTWDLRGNYFELTRTDGDSSSSAPRLTPGRTYWVQVRAINDARENLSGYSKAVAVQVPDSGPSELDPVDLKSTVAGADSAYVSWRSRGPGLSYLVRYTDDPSQPVTSWSSQKFDVAGGLVTGLKKSTRYVFRARVIDSAGQALSDYSSASNAPTVTTPATTTSPRLSMVSYNVLKASASPSWTSRRQAVAANILSQAPDVVALQEATPVTTSNGKKQYDDIVSLLGSKYSLTTRDGSSGTKLIYNTSRLVAKKTGVKALTTIGSQMRYASWAIFEDRLTGKQFFVIDTHLEPGDQTAKYNDARIKQAKEVLNLVSANAGSRPVVIAGDMNSGRSAVPNNGQYLAFTRAGFVDPTGNTSATFATGSNRTMEHAIDLEYNSANKMLRTAPRSKFPVGTTIDWIYTSPSIRVATWRTVVTVDTAGKFIGTIPSDHNMYAVNLHMP